MFPVKNYLKNRLLLRSVLHLNPKIIILKGERNPFVKSKGYNRHKYINRSALTTEEENK